MTSSNKHEWHEQILEPLVARTRERKQRFETDSGIEISPLYTPTEPIDAEYKEGLGFPGEYPFTRGVQPNMYRGRFWTMRQYAGFASAEESNHRFRYLLENGQTGLSVAFDLPTQMGYDSDSLPATYHAFYDPASGASKPDDGRPVYEGLRPEFVWPASA